MGLLYTTVCASTQMSIFSVAATVKPDKSAGNILRKALDPALLRAAPECERDAWKPLSEYDFSGIANQDRLCRPG